MSELKNGCYKDGVQMTDEEILKDGLDMLEDACAMLYELETEMGTVIAFMADSALRLGRAIQSGDDPRQSRD